MKSTRARTRPFVEFVAALHQTQIQVMPQLIGNMLEIRGQSPSSRLSGKRETNIQKKKKKKRRNRKSINTKKKPKSYTSTKNKKPISQANII